MRFKKPAMCGGPDVFPLFGWHLMDYCGEVSAIGKAVAMAVAIRHVHKLLRQGGDCRLWTAEKNPVRCELMSKDHGNSSKNSYGQLMEFLLSERHRYGSEEEFRAYALGEVRRFVSELRELEIELTLRPNFLEKSSWISAQRKSEGE
jgi:hypothetical protein